MSVATEHGLGEGGCIAVDVIGIRVDVKGSTEGGHSRSHAHLARMRALRAAGYGRGFCNSTQRVFVFPESLEILGSRRRVGGIDVDGE
eukprot:1185758-Prorocentrum_minimum.AAC.1